MKGESEKIWEFWAKSEKTKEIFLIVFFCFF